MWQDDGLHQPNSWPTHPGSHGLPTTSEDGLKSNMPNTEQKDLAEQHLVLNEVGLVIQVRCEIWFLVSTQGSCHWDLCRRGVWATWSSSHATKWHTSQDSASCWDVIFQFFSPISRGLSNRSCSVFLKSTMRDVLNFYRSPSFRIYLPYMKGTSLSVSICNTS